MAERSAQPEVDEASDGQEVETAAPSSSDQPAVGTRLAARTPMVEPAMRQALNEVAIDGTGTGFAAVLHHVIYGGFLLVALLNYGQVATGREGGEEQH